ncbi:tyrosine-type recombinase/integrase [Pauljensenia sp. UMB10120]|uniref:site-specific integrase n=1 Tax=Pauljensenia sp. UMB10120 TaxID=3046356 RepID=UPI00254A5B64|nr:site-specific integrase [Pauljensenia sp. UMB10120]MDK6243496.1 tyrosine-type recombinase/integrase [Pauljensenia sp. UMB10120]
MGKRRGFGNIRKLPSGRFQASYRGPDGERHNAPITFERKRQAEQWLATVQASIATGTWQSEEEQKQERVSRLEAEQAAALTFTDWSERWLASLESIGRAEKTIQTYRYRVRQLREVFGSTPIVLITPSDVQDWYNQSMKERGQGVTRPLYMTLSSCLGAAVKAGKLTQSPCRVQGGQQHKPVADPQRQVATPAEVLACADAMPPSLRLTVLLAAWCALREGEIIGLRRADFTLTDMPVVRVERQVQYLAGRGPVVVPPKSETGRRAISIPSSLVPAIREHLDAWSGDQLVFHREGDQSMPVHPNTLRAAWNRARKAAGIQWFKFHDLRHTGLTIYAQQGATLAELLHRGGHSDVEVALRYQHATAERDQALTTMMNTHIIV